MYNALVHETSEPKHSNSNFQAIFIVKMCADHHTFVVSYSLREVWEKIITHLPQPTSLLAGLASLLLLIDVGPSYYVMNSPAGLLVSTSRWINI